MAIASKKAMDKIIGACNLEAHSGLRPIDSMALVASLPMEIEGKITPKAMVKPATIVLIKGRLSVIPLMVSFSIILLALAEFYICLRPLINLNNKIYSMMCRGHSDKHDSKHSKNQSLN